MPGDECAQTGLPFSISTTSAWPAGRWKHASRHWSGRVTEQAPQSAMQIHWRGDPIRVRAWVQVHAELRSLAPSCQRQVNLELWSRYSSSAQTPAQCLSSCSSLAAPAGKPDGCACAHQISIWCCCTRALQALEHAPFPDAACSGEALRKSWTQPPTTNLWLWIKADCCDTVAPPTWCCWCRCWTGQLTTAACDPALGLAWDWSEDARQCGASHVSQPALQRLLAG